MTATLHTTPAGQAPDGGLTRANTAHFLGAFVRPNSRGGTGLDREEERRVAEASGHVTRDRLGRRGPRYGGFGGGDAGFTRRVPEEDGDTYITYSGYCAYQERAALDPDRAPLAPVFIMAIQDVDGVWRLIRWDSARNQPVH